MRKRAAWMASSLGVVALALTAWAGMAAAASGGGFNPDQQDCPWNADAWNTPPNYVPTGCHNFSVNVESGPSSGGNPTTDGNPNPDNTRFAEFGVDSLPNNPGNPSFGVEENIGDPGTADSPHSGCLAINTDGTNGGTGTGCGNNPNGAGFSATWDYYGIYCPATSMLPAALFPLPPPQSIPDPTGQVFGSTDTPALYQCTSTAQPLTVQPDQGNKSALQQIATQGVIVYVGSFDNLDNGEHDGFTGIDGPCGTNPTTGMPYTCASGGAINGASDGGALLLSLTPQSALNMPSATNPEGLVNASEGECADSICAEATTQQQAVYYGCVPKNKNNASPEAAPQVTNGKNPNGGNQWNDVKCTDGTPSSTKAYQNDTPASTQEGPNCNGGGPFSTETSPNCGTGDPNGYRASTPSKVYAEPGVQTYQDPDPQRSPALPFATPGLYVGTCGVYVNDGGGDGLGGITGANPGYVGGVNNCPVS